MLVYRAVVGRRRGRRWDFDRSFGGFVVVTVTRICSLGHGIIKYACRSLVPSAGL